VTWGLVKKQDCNQCANASRCYVKSASWNLAPVLTSVDKLVGPVEKYECAGGVLTMDCNGFKQTCCNELVYKGVCNCQQDKASDTSTTSCNQSCETTCKGQ
jgi:hypothetical protein